MMYLKRTIPESFIMEVEMTGSFFNFDYKA